MAALLDLSANASHTDIICTWDLSAYFSSVTSMVLTYTDLSSNEWTSVPVSGNSAGEYTEIISGLDADTDYKVYLTVLGKNLASPPVRIVKLSNVVIVRTEFPVTRPTIAILAGKTYLQVLFKVEGANESNLDPYDFTSVNNDIDNFVVSCNDLTATAGQNTSNELTAPSARLFSKNDVQTYSFRVGEDDYTYKYVLISDLQENSLHEVAVTYYTDNGLDFTSNTLQMRTLSNADTFASFAVNDLFFNYVGGTPSITVTWRDPVKAVHPDTVADVASRPKSILRQYKEDELWVDDVTYNLYQVSDAELLTGFVYGKYTGDGSGNFTFSGDTVGLVAGKQYQYVITMRDIADTVDTTSTTNYLGDADIDGTLTAQFDPVVALQRPTLAIPATAFTLDVLSGNFSFDVSFSEIVLNTGGFTESEFASDVFLLQYTTNNGIEWHSEEIINVEGRLSCADIERNLGSDHAETKFKITAQPSHPTSYITTQGSSTVTTLDQTADAASSFLVGNFNTTLPGDVTGFEYKNVTDLDADLADATITLTWNSLDNPADDKTNNLVREFYRVVATKGLETRKFFLAANFADVASYITIAGTDSFGNYVTSGSTYKFRFNAVSGAFFDLGEEYEFTIERGYVNQNTIASSPVGESGASGSELLFGNVATQEYALRVFTNPPAPTVTNFVFNSSNSEFKFDLAYASGTYGFTHAETYFEYYLTNNTQSILENAITTQTTGETIIDMLNIGSVGDSFTLIVREYVDTTYISNSLSTNLFYSSEVTFEFKKQGPLAQPASFISYKNTGLENQDGTQMKIEWALVTDAAATALEVPVYYELTVYDETEDDEQVDKYFLLESVPSGNMFKAADLAAPGPEYYTYTAASGTGVYIYTGLTLGHSYSYEIVARYYAPDFDAYVSCDAKATLHSLLAFGPLPVPSALIDVEANHLVLNFDMAYNSTNNSGVLNADLAFEYIALDEIGDPTGDPETLIAGENQVNVSDKFSGIAEGDIILVGFRTQFNTYSASDGTTDKFTSDIVSNFASVNPVRFTHSPQIKSVELSYSSGGANIYVYHEINGENPDEVHAVTTSLNESNVSTTATYYDGNPVSNARNKIGDFMYVLTVPDVKVGGLKFLSIAMHNSNGLGVAQASASGGLVAGTYILDPVNPTIFKFVLR